MSQRYLGGIITANPTAPTLTSASGVWTTEQQFQNIANWPKSTGLVSRSVRLRSSASAYFNQTPVSVGNRRTWTWSGWVKRGVFGNDEALFSGGTSDPITTIRFSGEGAASPDGIRVFHYAGAFQFDLTTTAQYRDPSAWYHIVVACDTTQATSTNRLKLYVNGVQVTAFDTATYPSQNYDTSISNNVLQTIGRNGNGSNYFGGYLTEVNFIDGQALTPSYFGFTDGNGVWQPATYSGTYGTNGFYLNFSDNSGATATTIGKDYSGNGNNWTPNNISVTAGVTYDSMLDSPTPYADGGNGRGNYCVLNPLNSTASLLYDANLRAYQGVPGTISPALSTVAVSSGKWYWECAFSGINSGSGYDAFVGISPSTFTPATANYPGQASGSYGYYSANGQKYTAGAGSAYGATWTDANIIGVALDLDAGTLTFYKDNVSQGTAFSGISGTFYMAVSSKGAGVYVNFGQRPFTYTPPTGFVALNTQNLSTPTISNGAAYMAATTYTGNGSTQTINNSVNGVSFAPDLVWVKVRSSAATHGLIDSVRGAGIALASNLTDAERNNGTGAGGDVIAFNSNGFNLGNNTTGSATNSNLSGSTYVGWQWNAGGSTVTNTNGSISSQVRANATAGFSVVTYTGTGANATVGHGLGVAPKMVIVKQRTGTAQQWVIWHTALLGTEYLGFDTAAKNALANVWNSTIPTSSVFSIGPNGSSGANTINYVAYCFAAVAGYSAFGSYTGNGSADGVFVYLGFRARFLMIKRTDSTGGWVMLDTARDTYNDVDNYLYANSSAADAGSSNVLDINSNGFKIRNSWTDINASGGTYVYMAFAENPFKLSRAR